MRPEETGQKVDCIFCDRIAHNAVFAQNELAVAFADGYPLSNGHTLIVPRRHETNFFELSPLERSAVFELASLVKKHLDREHNPSGYNIGVNIGDAAGQTISHTHLHVIPRYAGDVEDPRGGIRWVLPEHAVYWR